ncbi:chromogranin-A [Suncus etruscus]|uniref:chromogranin-A n=1 Tax=Suncus etruscus TaxID=109475 RepID=UPI00210FC9E8|nr:chromogranin-A [Suncus etruscus]
MHPAAVLALLLCAGQVIAIPVNSLVNNKGDTEVMKCIVEVISDTLSKPSPKPVSQKCFETLRGDERILSILRHQNLLKELQDLARQGVKERSQQQMKQSSLEDELVDTFQKQGKQTPLKASTVGMAPASSQLVAEEKRASEKMEIYRDWPQAFTRRNQKDEAPGKKEEEDEEEEGEEGASPSQAPAGFTNLKHSVSEAKGDNEDNALGQVVAEQMHQAEGAAKKEEKEEAGAKKSGGQALPDEDPTTALSTAPSFSTTENPSRAGTSDIEALACVGDKGGPSGSTIQKWVLTHGGGLGNGSQDGVSLSHSPAFIHCPGESEAPTVNGVRRTEAEEPQHPKKKGTQQHDRQLELEEEQMKEELEGTPRSPSKQLGPKEVEQEEQGEGGQHPTTPKRWSKMDQLAEELAAEKRRERGAEMLAEPDDSMKLRSPAYEFRGHGLARGWRPASQEDILEGDLPLRMRGYPEERKEEEGSANRRAEDQELESLAAIEAELEKVAQELEALRRG